MKTIEEIISKNNVLISYLTYNSCEKAMKQYAEQVIDEYERKLNEYNGSIPYSEISNQLKKELK